MRTNNRPQPCEICRKMTAAGCGILENVDGWKVYHRECYPNQLVIEPRRLTADFEIRTPYEPQNLELFRSFPGARWDKPALCWKVSPDACDRKRVIELAERLQLEIDPSIDREPKTETVDQAGEVRTRATGPVPEGKTLFGYQNAGVTFLAGRKRALLGDEMGTGKTIQTLIALPPADECRAVIVCPASLKPNWRNECRAWRPDLQPRIVNGKGNLYTPRAGEVVIVNYDILPDEPPMNWDGIVMVCDEAHKASNYKAAMAKRTKGLQAANKNGQVWFLTGTPLLTRPLQLYGILQAAGLDKPVFGGWQGFVRAFHGVQGRYGWTWGMPEAWVAERLRNVMLRRLKKDVLKDLPAKIYQNVEIGIDEFTGELRRKLDKVWEDEDISAREETDDLPAFDQFSKIRAQLATETIPFLQDYVVQYEEADEPIVVFSAHRAPVEAMKGREGWRAILGDTPNETRAAIVADFQAGKLKGVALTIAAGGVGLTLTRAGTVIFPDLDWTPALNSQAEDRLHRIGQSHSCVNVVRFVVDHPLTRHVHKLLCYKIKLAATAIDGAPLTAYIPPTRGQGETAAEFVARKAEIDRIRGEREAVDRKAKEEQEAGKRNSAKSRTAQRLELERKREPAPIDFDPAEVKTAFAFMLSVCDGAAERDNQGFNKPDAFMAHVVLSTGLETETEIECAARMLRRYPRQTKTLAPSIWRMTR